MIEDRSGDDTAFVFRKGSLKATAGSAGQGEGGSISEPLVDCQALEGGLRGRHVCSLE